MDRTTVLAVVKATGPTHAAISQKEAEGKEAKSEEPKKEEGVCGAEPALPVPGVVWLLPAPGVCALEGVLEVSIEPLLGAPGEVVLGLLVDWVVV